MSFKNRIETEGEKQKNLYGLFRFLYDQIGNFLC